MERVMEAIRVNEIELSRSSWHVNYFSQIKTILCTAHAMVRHNFIEPTSSVLGKCTVAALRIQFTSPRCAFRTMMAECWPLNVGILMAELKTSVSQLAQMIGTFTTGVHYTREQCSNILIMSAIFVIRVSNVLMTLHVTPSLCTFSDVIQYCARFACVPSVIAIHYTT